MGSVRIIRASAGSGKTYRLAYEYVSKVIADPGKYRSILAVTFTNKATAEMKERILREIDALASGKESPYLSELINETGLTADSIRSRAHTARHNILHDYGRFSVQTIDRFFQRIVRSFLRELGIDHGFMLELRTDTILAQAADRLIERIPSDSILRRMLLEMIEERIGEGKKWDIRSGLTGLGTELFTERFAMRERGTAKPGQLTELFESLFKKHAIIVNGAKSLARQALTYMNSCQLEAADFSGGSRSFANYFTKVATDGPQLYGPSVAKVLDDASKWYSKTSDKKERIESATPELQKILGEICTVWDKEGRFLTTVELIQRNYRNFTLLSDLDRMIREICLEGNIVPIAETNRLITQLIDRSDAPFIYEKVGVRYTDYMIDEFQDTSQRQWDNFTPLLSNSLSASDGTPVLIVGDVKQSIYRWRGANWKAVADGAASLSPQTDHLVLDTNYRSLPAVVDFNNRLFAGIVGDVNSNLDSMLEQAAQTANISRETHSQLTGITRQAYSAIEQKTSRSSPQGHVRATLHPREMTEEDFQKMLLRRIDDILDRGYKPGDIAILVRSNADGRNIAAMLLDGSCSRHDYRIVSEDSLLVSSSETVSFIVSVMKIVTGTANILHRAIYNKYTGRTLTGEPTEKDRLIFDQLALMSPYAAYETILLHYKESVIPSEQAYITAFGQQIIEFGKKNIGDTDVFLKWWDETGCRQSLNLPEQGSAITISTIHKAKGLQYKTVIVPYCNWTMGPSNQTIVWAGLHEPESAGSVPVNFCEAMNRSLFSEDYYREYILTSVDNLNTLYVAFTRAEQELHVFIPRGKHLRTDNCGDMVASYLEQSAVEAIVSNDTQDFLFGTPCVAESTEVEIPEATVNQQVYPLEGRLNVRRRYDLSNFADTDGMNDPRKFGNFLHDAFSRANDKAALMENIKNLSHQGILNFEESAQICAHVESVVDREPCCRWFSAHWDKTLNEAGIIVPGAGTGYRPDRVMCIGKRAVVVDYKFGDLQKKSYVRQLQHYMKLLQQMGFTDVEGYIWYVALEQIEKIPAGASQPELFD